MWHKSGTKKNNYIYIYVYIYMFIYTYMLYLKLDAFLFLKGQCILMHHFDFPAGLATAKTPVLLMVGSLRMLGSLPSGPSGSRGT